MILVVAPQFGYVLLSAILIAVECVFIGFLFPGRTRGQVFNEQFMKDNFGKIHQEAFATQIQKGGYPDMGDGVYAQKLSYENWFKFANAQRAHYNFVEAISSILVLLIVSGLYFPILASGFGFLYFISRAVYAYGYARGGPAGRLAGGLINTFCSVAFLVLSFWSVINFILQKPLGNAEF